MRAASVSKRSFDYKAILFFLTVTLASGLLGGLLGGIDGFQSLKCPVFMIPTNLFPAVWSILYLMTGFAAYLVWNANDIDSARVLRLYLLQLLVNALRSLFFFRFEWRLFSFFWSLFLIALVTLLMTGFKFISKPAYYLSIPYLIWLIYIACLNFGFYIMNMK